MTKFTNVLYATLAGSAISKTQVSINQSVRTGGEQLLAQSLESSAIDAILNHGCWCQKFGPFSDQENLGGSYTADALDEICKHWFTARRCNDAHEGGSCFDSNYDNLGGTSVYTINGDKCSKNDNNSCEQDSCKIDMEYLSKIEEFLAANPGWSAEQPNSCPSGEPNNGSAKRYCVGTVPDVYLSPDMPTTPAPTTTPKAELDEDQVKASCANRELDITILVDGSGSIDDANWSKTVDFVSGVTGMFDISPQKTKVTLAQYSYDMKYYGQRFNQWPRQLSNSVEALRNDQMKSSTMTNVALNGIMNNMNVFGRPGVPQIVILLTDGASSRGLTYPWAGHANAYDTADQLENMGVTTFVLAVGDEVDQSENERIASTPVSEYLIPVANHDVLEEVNLKITNIACGLSRSVRISQPNFMAKGEDSEGVDNYVPTDAMFGGPRAGEE